MVNATFHRGVRHGRRAVLLALAAAALAWAPAAEARPSVGGIFGYTEVRSDDLGPFVKWTGMLDRFLLEDGEAGGDCTSTSYNACHHQEWQALIADLRGQDLEAQLERVNRFMNQRRYIVDPINWGVRDYWATPRQFFRKQGDCEDYAIAKYLTLRALGVSDAQMRIVVLQDLNLGIPHAVLAVATADGTMILDNQISQVVDARVIRHYQPIYSINERAWWLHRPPG